MAEEGKTLADLAAEQPDAEQQDVEVVTGEVVTLSEEEQAAVHEVAGKVSEVVAHAASLEVRTGTEAAGAAEFLARIARERKTAEAARDKLVRPLNEHVAMINASFRPNRDALDEARGIVQGKIVTFQQEEERKAREEQARLDAERAARQRELEEAQRAAEAEAQRQREAAAREAAQREEQARKAAAEAQAAREKLVGELADAMRRLSDQVLELEATNTSQHADPDRVEAAKLVLAERKAQADAARAAHEAEAAAEAERVAREAEQRARETPVEDAPQSVAVAAATSGPLRTGSGSVSRRKRWTFEVTDPAKVPLTYQLPVDGGEVEEELVQLRPPEPKAIRKLVNAGVRELPGVRIFEDTSLSVRDGGSVGKS